MALGPLGTAAPASAQVVVVDADGVSDLRARRWRTRLEASLESEPLGFEAWARARAPVSTVPAERLEVLSLIETLLVRARHARSQLLEREALLALGRAEQIALRHLDVPGMAAWYAEVQLAIAIASAQAGQEAVSQAALRRAASVDPTRSVQAAEARPEVVAQARAIALVSATAPRGRFEVRSTVNGAVAFLDDERVGALPTTVEAAVGPHVLRIDAPGHRSWATVMTVFEGRRPPVDVVLAATPELSAARAAARLARDGDPAELVAALRSLDDAPTVYRLRPASGDFDRAALTICRSTGCDGPRLLEGELGAELSGPEATRAEAQRWLQEREAHVIEASPWWERWYVWAAAGAVAAAAVATGAGIALGQGDEPPPLILTVDPGQLPVTGVD